MAMSQEEFRAALVGMRERAGALEAGASALRLQANELVSAFDALAGGGETTPPPPTDRTLVPLTVRGKELVDTAGARVRLPGVNLAYAVPAYLWQGQVDGEMKAVNAWYQRDMRHRTELAAAGCRIVRIPVRNDGSAGYAATLVALVKDWNGRGVYVLLCPFGEFGSFPSSAPTIVTRLLQLWNACGGPAAPGVLLETVNEPNGISDGAWLNGTNAVVKGLRDGGYRQPVFADGQGWAWQLPANHTQITDPNVVMVSHRYAVADPGAPPRGPQDADQWAAEWSKSTRPVWLGELGPYNGGFGNGGTFSGNVAQWCTPMAAKIQAEMLAGSPWLCGYGAWTVLWGDDRAPANELVSPMPGASQGDWWGVADPNSPGWQWNAWGALVGKLLTATR